MKNFKTYLPVAFQAVLVVLGFLLINAGLANENAIPESKLSMHLTIDQESEPAIEYWMTDLSNWETYETKKPNKEGVAANPATSAFEVADSESEIQVEEWMSDAGDNYWELKANTLNEDTEEELELEDWMANLEEWNK